MALTEIQQFQKMFENSTYVLVLFNPRSNGDALASALALKLYFEKQQKQVDVAASEYMVPKSLRFLPGSDAVRPELTHLQKFIVKVDVSKAPLDTLSYEVKDNWLSIYLTPKHGTITREELRTAQTTFKYDLIVTIGAPDLESLGNIFLNNTDLFYKTPIINIDHQAANERYGQVNVLDLTASANAEVVYKTLKAMSGNILDPAVATALLTGMTIATNSFKNPHIPPTSLQLASQLVAQGADREQVVHHLYRTRSIATLRLWGQALSHLVSDPALGLVSTTVTREDFSRSGSTPDDLRGLIEELISNSPEAKIIVLLYEREDKNIGGTIAAEKEYNAIELIKPLNPKGNKKQASVVIPNTTLKEAEEKIKEIIRAGRAGRP